MAKSKILKELASNQTSLDVVLSRLIIIASDIEDIKLQEWALNELNGYSKNENVPEYRQLQGELIYSGINGPLMVNKLHLDIGFLDKDFQEIVLQPFVVSNGISLLLSGLENGEIFSKDMTFLSSQVYKNSATITGAIQATNIALVFNKAQIQNIISNVRTKLLQIFLELDKNYGNLDELDVSQQIDDIDSVKQTIHQIIYQDNSITNSGEINLATGKSVLEINQNNGIDGDQLNNILIQIRQTQENISSSDKEAISEFLEVIEEQIKLDKPKKSLLKTAISGLQAIKGTTEFAVAVTALGQFFHIL
ncbi:MAG: hypothetical protein L0G39_19585 [Chryseobacterium sp.]|nr:hypothetical protein [Chryseobacterium sp.]